MYSFHARFWSVHFVLYKETKMFLKTPLQYFKITIRTYISFGQNTAEVSYCTEAFESVKPLKLILLFMFYIRFLESEPENLNNYDIDLIFFRLAMPC